MEFIYSDITVICIMGFCFFLCHFLYYLFLLMLSGFCCFFSVTEVACLAVPSAHYRSCIDVSQYLVICSQPILILFHRQRFSRRLYTYVDFSCLHINLPLRWMFMVSSLPTYPHCLPFTAVHSSPATLTCITRPDFLSTSP